LKRFGKNFSIITCSAFVFFISLHAFVKVQQPRPAARFKGLGEKNTFLGGRGFCCLKQFFWAQRNLGSIKMLLPNAPRDYGPEQTSSYYFIN